MAIMPRPSAAPQIRPQGATGAPLRRCTFRHVATVARRGELPIYEVACMFPDRRTPIPLGDIESARPICESCTAIGIFRPDAD